MCVNRINTLSINYGVLTKGENIKKLQNKGKYKIGGNLVT
ncbi:hypothetical protein ClosIBUN22A_CONTIG37g00741 [Clostridium sp. IBUN22A]|nr:hypothetical protein CBDKU1_02550 [Clostridium butyricum DKU-01]KJZ85141.1 hypothetical protein ClosIBUN125C_CONTIG56g03077 [Clostridium sp. IBUN125C]KJZ88513.1 hypothetical protein ClosIBUN22A_CONTIG37g00741 [Clostridium sp. IBUN22A]KJZ95972.1 hypothetical protein ClosIBUN62F_CONTIG10g00428 [Clostridium sp. IBUN62F]